MLAGEVSGMRNVNQLLYALFALLWIGLGVGALAGLQSGNPPVEEVHLGRELGAAVVFVGFMHAWCLVHYERRIAVHLGLMLFAVLFAGIHWYDWAGGRRGIVSPLVNSIPLVVLAVMLRRGRAAPAP